jgi:hypothetical protein
MWGLAMLAVRLNADCIYFLIFLLGFSSFLDFFFQSVA